MPGDGDDGDADEPLADLVRETRARRGPRDDGDGDEADWNDLFESVETAEIDPEAVWEALSDDADDPAVARGVGSDPGAVEASGGRGLGPGVDEHVVPKRQFCQRCPHFSDPPTVACTREGTAVVEVVDVDRFRVRNCPVARDATAGRDAD